MAAEKLPPDNLLRALRVLIRAEQGSKSEAEI